MMQSRSSIGNAGPASLPDTELQADVMRFVAILALCLVAISSLVEHSRQPVDQSPVPVESVVATEAPQAATAQRRAPPEPVVEPLETRSMPAAEKRSAPMPEVSVARSPAVKLDEAQPAEQGLLLRFASDAALLRMVSRGEAAVFVATAAGVRRLDLRRGVDFVSATAPEAFYRMAPETIPTLLRASYPGPDDALWGVTLPGRTVAALRDHLAKGGGGVLVIDATGNVTREVNDG
ncbi:MAG: hypothetical protein JSW21_11540 [Gammaproteobacteria bacterium]|nr:MAG: hypothetical protein JSW21_11540 [Gammaproteobacteria bacterium]